VSESPKTGSPLPVHTPSIANVLQIEGFVGLREVDARTRLEQEGPNELPAQHKRNLLTIVLEVVREPMFLMLVAAGVVYLLLGEPADALMLLGFVFVVMTITIVQARRTEHALEALRDLSSPRALVIRGDYPATAQSIARHAGLTQCDTAITGADLERMSDEELARRVSEVQVFARVVPEQKLRIVSALKANNDVVAMTGDGVNDAPALKAAHIGIAMFTTTSRRPSSSSWRFTSRSPGFRCCRSFCRLAAPHPTPPTRPENAAVSRVEQAACPGRRPGADSSLERGSRTSSANPAREAQGRR